MRRQSEVLPAHAVASGGQAAQDRRVAGRTRAVGVDRWRGRSQQGDLGCSALRVAPRSSRSDWAGPIRVSLPTEHDCPPAQGTAPSSSCQGETQCQVCRRLFVVTRFYKFICLSMLPVRSRLLRALVAESGNEPPEKSFARQPYQPCGASNSHNDVPPPPVGPAGQRNDKGQNE